MYDQEVKHGPKEPNKHGKATFISCTYFKFIISHQRQLFET